MGFLKQHKLKKNLCRTLSTIIQPINLTTTLYSIFKFSLYFAIVCLIQLTRDFELLSFFFVFVVSREQMFAFLFLALTAFLFLSIALNVCECSMGQWYIRTFARRKKKYLKLITE